MRRRGRECALQILYQMDVGKSLDKGSVEEENMSSAFQSFWASFEEVSDSEKDFAERLVRGVVADLTALDDALTKASQNWRLERMDKVDRNVMRLAAYEILHCPDIPRTASINEAVEIAKRFSGSESAAFINGILDQLAPEAKTT